MTFSRQIVAFEKRLHPGRDIYLPPLGFTVTETTIVSTVFNFTSDLCSSCLLDTIGMITMLVPKSYVHIGTILGI